MANNSVEIALRLNAKQFKAALKGAKTTYGGAMGSVAASSDKAGASVQKLTGTVIKLSAAYLSVRQAVSLLRTVLDTSGNFESLRIQLDQLTGSAQAGEKAFEWVKAFTADTPFGLNEVTEGFVRLKAFGLDPMDGSYQAIADQAAALGGGQERLTGIILAVGQAWAKQKLQGEEILQLVERGVPVWDLLAKATGKSAIELQNLSAKGELGRDVISALLAEMGRGVDGAALANMDTWNGLISNATDQWKLFLNEIGQSGVMADFKQEIKSLLKEVARLRETGELQLYAQQVGQAIIAMKDALVGAMAIIAEYRGELGLLFKLMVSAKIAKGAGLLLGFVAATQKGTKATRVLITALRIRNALLTLGAAFLVETAINVVQAYNDRQRANERLAASEAEYAKALTARNERVARSERATMLASMSGYGRLMALRKKRRADQAQFTESLKLAKQAETKVIEAALKRQQALYKAHLVKLKQAQQSQQDIAKEFANFVAQVRSGGAQGPKEDPTIRDFSSGITKARKLLKQGDFDGAIDGARDLADMIRTMQQNGTEADLVLSGLAKKTEALANDAAAEKVESEGAKLEKAKQAIASLSKDAAFLGAITVGFNETLALANADKLREKIRQKLSDIPAVISVSYKLPELPADQNATPENAVNNAPALSNNVTPIKRPVQLDTTEAEKQLAALQAQAEQPAVKPVTTIYREGDSFSDRPINNDLQREALKKGTR